MKVIQLFPQKAYNKLKAFRTITDSEVYYSLLSKASDVLLHVTNHYYNKNDFETDHEQRQHAYLKALACQIEYFYETGEKTTAGLNHTPDMVVLGRTKISMVTNVNDDGTKIPQSIVCPDIYIYLDGTGLIGSDTP